MRNIYTCVDIGTDSIKIVTAEYYNDKYNVLASACVASNGVKKGKIYDANLICNALRKGFKNIESKLGTKVSQVIAVVPSDNMEIVIADSSIENSSEDQVITGDMIFSCMQNAIKGNIESGNEVVGVFPIEYVLDGNKKTHYALGMKSENMTMKSIVVSVPDKNVLTVVSALKTIGIEVVDVLTSEIGNYYSIKNKDFDSKVVGLIDIGADKTNVSVLNKGVLIKNSILPVGGNNLDQDIAITYGISIDSAKNIKKSFAVASRKYADSDEKFDILNNSGEKIEINQYNLAELIETRIIDILKNAKIELNRLTKKQIGYIMVTGGISSMLGFNSVVEDLYPKNAASMMLNVLGIRDNKYSLAYGGIKYFHDKLTLRQKEYTMFSEEKIDEMLSPRKKMGSNNNVLGKIFGKIFD